MTARRYQFPRGRGKQIAGFRSPPNSHRCTRPSRWKNPFVLAEDGGTYTREESLKLFKEYVTKRIQEGSLDLGHLRQFDWLGCVCEPHLPCHVDVLIAIEESLE